MTFDYWLSLGKDLSGLKDVVKSSTASHLAAQRYMMETQRQVILRFIDIKPQESFSLSDHTPVPKNTELARKMENLVGPEKQQR